MLVLSRRKGESIVIGDDITIEVVKVGYNIVRLGITAPSEVPVHREEVYQQNQVHNTIADVVDFNISGGHRG